MSSIEDIKRAYQRIRDFANKTPVFTSRTLNKITGALVYLKCENFQKMGAFKFRGAFNTLSLLSEEEKAKGVITHSSGNHAQAVALSSSILGIKATIVMPKGASEVKKRATKDYGATVVFCENTLKSRTEVSNKLIEKHGYMLIHPYDNDNIINGAGTAALELIQEVGDLDIVIAPLGGGGLLSGTAIATKGLLPNAKVYGVEPELADDAYRSVQAGKLILSTYPNTIADGLRTSLSERTLNIIKKHVDGILLVSESEILEGMRFIWERMKLVVEPSGAVPLSAIISGKLSVKNKKVGLVISG